MPMRSKLEWVTMMASHSPVEILAVRCLRRSLVKSSLAATSSLRVGIDVLKLAGELLQQVIGHGDEGFLDEPGLLHLHGRSRPSTPTCRRRRNAPAAYCRRSCPATRHLSDAGEAETPRSFRERPGASRRTAVGAGCCRCRCTVRTSRSARSGSVNIQVLKRSLISFLLLAGGECFVLVDDFSCRGRRDRDRRSSAFSCLTPVRTTSRR